MVYAFEKDTSAVTAGSIDRDSFKGDWPKVKKHIFLKEMAPWTVLSDDGAERLDTSSFAHLVEPHSTPK